MELERLCLTFRGEVEYQLETQEVLKRPGGQQKGNAKSSTRRMSEKILRGVKGSRRAEAKEALVPVHKKHNLYKMEEERQRARTLQRLEMTSTTSP